MEHWKQIDGEPGYEVSDLGRVRSEGKLLKGIKLGRGYLAVWLPNSRRRVALHRLVAQYFLGDLGDLDVHHIDRCKSNNAAANLQRIGRKEHMEEHYEETHPPLHKDPALKPFIEEAKRLYPWMFDAYESFNYQI